MATTYWIGNARATAQVSKALVTAVAVGGTLTATINTKAVTYTAVTGDTVASAATAWLALLANESTAPPEFQEENWSGPSDGVVLATAAAAGTPFTVAFTAAGGCAVTQSTPVANSSPSDAADPLNWLRSAANAIPQNGDAVLLADSGVPILWNLSALAAVQFASFERRRSFAANVGLPRVNPLGYYEYRPTYFAFVGPPAGRLPVTLGGGTGGGGPGRERYDTGAQAVDLVVLSSGGALDDFAVLWKGSDATSTASVVGTSLGIAVGPGETAALASASVDGGGGLALGEGVTMSAPKTVDVISGSASVACGCDAISADNGSAVAVESLAKTYASVAARNGSRVAWLTDSTITALLLKAGSVLDKSGDLRAATVTDSEIDGDTCAILDPNSVLTFTNATVVNGQVTSGPFAFTGPRTVKLG